MNKLWHLALATVVTVAVALLKLNQRAFDPSSAAVFGSILAFASPAATIILGLMGLLLALDSRPFIQGLKKWADGKHYKELIDLSWSALRAFVLLIGVSAVGVVLKNTDRFWLPRIVPLAALFLTVVSLVQMYRLGAKLVFVMRDDYKSSRPHPASTPAPAPPAPVADPKSGQDAVGAVSN